MCITQELSKKLGKYCILMKIYLNYQTSIKPLLLKKKMGRSSPWAIGIIN